MDTLVLSLLLLLALLYPLFWFVAQLRRYYKLRFHGFWVFRKGRNEIVYEERRAHKTYRLTIYTERMAYGRTVVYVPTEEEWQNEMPEWAQGQRLEILEKIKRTLGTAYEYDSEVL